MEIIPKYCEITVNETNISEGREVIDDTGRVLESAYQELLDINDALLSEFTGDVKTAFTSARETTEKKLAAAISVLGSVSDTFSDYIKNNKVINMEAGLLAGGKNNE